MKLAYFSFLTLVLVALACKKAQREESEWLNAVVADTKDINCGLPRLDFFEDAEKIRAITGDAYNLQFISKGLPPALNIEGKRVSVLITKLKSEESFACLTLGPNYPAIKIISATAR